MIIIQMLARGQGTGVAGNSKLTKAAQQTTVISPHHCGKGRKWKRDRKGKIVIAANNKAAIRTRLVSAIRKADMNHAHRR
ncbi:hypothetical protein [Vogesella mureinivorans]|uniref:hypothetical protein n=1 Tax=Vogesella mureinivorans TaxID=657276 RepID=UPI001F103EC1|nr:hypothetical protein [Vogesella mureinivorans]